MNEARLSAIALCIYFAAVLETPAPELQILALDDVLIGLDMEHRLPVLRVLEQYFADYDILLFTYDPVWFSIVQETVDENLWDFIRIHKPSDVRSQVPIIGDRGYLQTARDHLSRGDLRSAANYARSAFEKAMQDFCQKKSVPIRFKFLLKDLNSEDFLNAILSWQQGEVVVVIDGALQADIRAARRITLNPLSHAPPVPLTSREVQNAIDVVARLEIALSKKTT